MRRMIVTIALIGLALLFGAVATPGIAGYRHGSYYCQSRECAAYYNCGYYKKCCSYYQYYDCAPYQGGGGYYSRKHYYNGGGGGY
jgi:hypothetical protein